MRQRTTATSQLPDYIYMPLGDGSADVFIYKFVSYDEENDEYEYETNEFRSWTVTEDEVKANPFKYLDFCENIDIEMEEKVKALEERNAMLEECIIEMANIIYA